MKKVIVLGATSGIGRALVEALRAEGIETIATGRRKALLESLGEPWIELDVTSPQLTEVLDAVRPDTIFYNAGYGERSEMPDWARTEQAIQVNVVGFERAAQWALQHAERFVATASIAGLRGLEMTNGYSASKAYMINAMEGYRRWARALKTSCRFVTLLPGFVDTAMGQASTFWRCSPKVAVSCIIRIVKSNSRIGYVTPRWRWIAWLMGILPCWMFERLVLTQTKECNE